MHTPPTEKSYFAVERIAREQGIHFEVDNRPTPEILNVKSAGPIESFSEANRYSEVLLVVLLTSIVSQAAGGAISAKLFPLETGER